MGSAIHVDGGDATTPAGTIINKGTSALTMHNPQILGTVNSIYATASGVIYIEGGNIFSCSSGRSRPLCFHRWPDSAEHRWHRSHWRRRLREP